VVSADELDTDLFGQMHIIAECAWRKLVFRLDILRGVVHYLVHLYTQLVRRILPEIVSQPDTLGLMVVVAFLV
jgi:hypothetical protein